MKLSIGALLSISTLVASILIGGATFGDLRGSVRENTNSIQIYRTVTLDTIRELRNENKEMLKVLAGLHSDMQWVKQHLQNKKE